MTFSYMENETHANAKIKVIGVGGAGGNAVNNMIDSNLQGVKFIVANTDAQALELSKAEKKIQLGAQLTQGLGAGANPNIGRDAALENIEELRAALIDSHMVFITAGLGGGTGTGAAPVIAEICKELGILTVAVVSRPFSFEGKKRASQAEEGIANLRDITDTVITIPNDRLRGLASPGAKMREMFIRADEILHHSVKGITDLIMLPGHINLDFADVRTTMSKAGMALMGIGIASGENRAVEAAEKAISHPLLEDISIAGARGVLMNITCSSDITMDEVMEASDRIYQEVGDDAEIIWGQTFDETLGDEMRVTVIATGIGMDESSRSANVLPLNKNIRHKKFHKIEQDTPVAVPTPIQGKVRPPTPEELNNWDEEEAVVVKKTTYKKTANEDGRNAPRSSFLDFDNLEIPTFLRKKAD
ncbi:MAG: cell division protein FtsZ [Desulfamplus sp.]|nr:cell division protein FtsZ [Desulfamplus sp.]MBF0209704.1 cell division protein FtsZ [Desulfamplus sp.]MBF0242690.1 cell division protein FtsZ [Desulfamplus sp.]